MLVRTGKVRKQVLGQSLPLLFRQSLGLIGRFDPAKQVSELCLGVCDLAAGNRVIHDEAASLRKSRHRECKGHRK